MKKLFTILVFTVGAVCFGQSLPIDFDDASDAGFTVAGGAAFTGAVDGTDNVGQIVGGTDQWDSRVDLALDTWIDMTTAAKTFTFDFHTSEAVIMTGLLQISNEKSGGFPIEMQFTTDGNIGWETITLDFTSATNGYPNAADPVVYGEYARISLFTNFGDTGTSTYMFDDLAGAANGGTVETCSDGVLNNGETAIDCGGANCSPCVTGPATAAPLPPARNSWDVISVYGEAYGTAIGLNNTDWDKANFVDETIADNVVLKAQLSGGDYIGADLGIKINASEMTHFHIDYWIAGDLLTGQTMNTKWSNHVGGNVETSSFQDYNAAPEAGIWKSRDINIEALTGIGNGDFSRAELAQIIVTLSAADAKNPSAIYIDNVYFYRAATASINDLESHVNVYPNPVKNSLNINAATTIDAVNIYDITGREVLRATPNVEKTSLDVSSLNKGFYLLTIKSGNQELTTKLVK